MKIIKFGGSCLKDSNDLRQISNILKNDKYQSRIIVLSAVSGVTDILVNSLKTKIHDKKSIDIIIDRVKELHINIIETYFSSQKEIDMAIKQMMPYLSRLKELYLAVLYSGEISMSLESSIHSFGERLSVVLFSMIMNREGLNTEPYFSDDIGIIKKDSKHQNCADMKQTKSNLDKIIPSVSVGIIPVITGYFALDHNKRVSTFGRNGSDYSASVIASCLNAEILEFWKNVPGFMSSDPALIKNSKLLKDLSIDEAAELSYFGTGVLHPRCLEPVRNSKTNIIIKNFSDPEKFGTLIKASSSKLNKIRGVTFNQHIAILKIKGSGVGYKPGLIGNIGTILSRNKINIYSIITTQTSINLIIDQKDLKRGGHLLQIINDPVIEEIQTEKDLTLIAIVGQNIKKMNTLQKLLTILNKLNINIEMISAGASESAYYFLIKKKEFKRSINEIHDSLLEN